MSKIIETIYQGKYRSTTDSPLVQEPITADAVNFTPVDLLMTAYGSCLLGTIDHVARQNKFEIAGVSTNISYEMNEEKTKVGKISIEIRLSNNYDNAQIKVIEFAAQNYCHVGKTLDPTIERTFKFVYNEK